MGALHDIVLVVRSVRDVHSGCEGPTAAISGADGVAAAVEHATEDPGWP
jgi:hypothetical protein